MLIIAHRGSSGYAPENTLAAMTVALQQKVEAIELDVHCVEGELVVFHDRRLEGKSNGKGLIHLTSKAQLSQITVKQQPIPTLREVLQLVNGQCIVNIELKGAFCIAPFIACYAKIFTELNFNKQQILVSSFNHLYLAAVKKHYPDALVAPLLGGIPLDLAQSATQLQAYSINLDLSFTSKALIDDAHQRGVKVLVYTVDNPDDIRALKSLGVDGIFSNYPDKAMLVAKEDVTASDYDGWFE